MNKLLSYTPEPFETIGTASLPPQAKTQETESAEWETELWRRRSPPRVERSVARPARVSRPPLRQPPARGGASPLFAEPRLPFVPLFPGLRRVPVYPLASLGWTDYPWVDRPPQRDGLPWDGDSDQAGLVSGHVQQLQDCLNRALGLRLPVNGQLSAATRSAIRLFQERQGLPVTGLAGPETEQALVEVCQSTGVQTESGGAWSQETAGIGQAIGFSPRWELPPDVQAAGAAQQIRYDSPDAWAGGRNCSGSFTPGAQALGQYIKANFPGVARVEGYNCRPNSANSSQTSMHGVGRAIDIMIPVKGGQANSAVGDPVANWLVRNAADIGVQYIIWNRVAWNGSRRGVKHGPYTGPVPHTDHIHAELNRDGAQRRTPWFGRTPSPPAPAPSAPSAYQPSPTRIRFEQATGNGNWQEAFLNLNGLNMFEMLRALSGLSAERRNALMGQREAFRNRVNMPRIEYALTVVQTRQLPNTAPGDLEATGQVQTAREFLRIPPSIPTPGNSVDVKRMKQAQFIEFVGNSARQSMHETGVPASVTVAQAILETGWGKHTIGDAKNLFGIKGQGPAGSVLAPTKEYINGKWVTVNAKFAKYDSYEQSITEHAKFFLRNRRYAKAMQVKGNPDDFARAIHQAGYATAPNYADVLISLMKRYNLYRFDRP